MGEKGLCVGDSLTFAGSTSNETGAIPLREGLGGNGVRLGEGGEERLGGG